jgi:hypothetical protein
MWKPFEREYLFPRQQKQIFPLFSLSTELCQLPKAERIDIIWVNMQELNNFQQQIYTVLWASWGKYIIGYNKRIHTFRPRKGLEGPEGE